MKIELSKRNIQLLHDLIKVERVNVKNNLEYDSDKKYLRYLKDLQNKLNVDYYHARLEAYDKFKAERGNK